MQTNIDQVLPVYMNIWWWMSKKEKQGHLNYVMFKHLEPESKVKTRNDKEKKDKLNLYQALTFMGLVWQRNG